MARARFRELSRASRAAHHTPPGASARAGLSLPVATMRALLFAALASSSAALTLQPHPKCCRHGAAGLRTVPVLERRGPPPRMGLPPEEEVVGPADEPSCLAQADESAMTPKDNLVFLGYIAGFVAFFYAAAAALAPLTQ